MRVEASKKTISGNSLYVNLTNDSGFSVQLGAYYADIGKLEPFAKVGSVSFWIPVAILKVIVLEFATFYDFGSCL